MDNEGTSVPLSQKIALSRPVGNPSYNQFDYEITTFSLVPGYVTACEIYNMRSYLSKEEYLLSFDAERADEIAAECGSVDELSDAVVAKINENCLDECQDLQRQAYNNLYEMFNADLIISLESEKRSDQLLKTLTASSQAITLLHEVPQLIREADDPTALIASSIAKIEDAKENDLITKAQKEQMISQVQESFKFNPLWTTSYEEILFNVKSGELSFKTLFDFIFFGNRNKKIAYFNPCLYLKR